MAYIGNSPENIQRGKRFVYEFKATAGQTVFSGTDLNNQTLDLLEENEMGVYLNGVRLADSDDYTVSGDTLTLVSAASLNDQLTVETQAEIANISSYTRAEADARYINYDGDIVAGDLQISGEVDAGSLIVDTDVLVVDATNDRVGVGNATPENALHVSSADDAQLLVQNTSTGDASIKLNRSGQTFFMGIESSDNSFRISDTGTGVGDGDRLIIDTSGKVGIGTESPVYQLHVNSGATNIVADFESTDGIAGIRLRDNTGNVELSASGNDFRVQPAGGTPAFTVTGAGRVGIGTDSPNAPLEIKVPSSGGGLTDSIQIRDSSNYVGIAMYAGAADGEIRVGAAGQLRGRYAAQYAGTRSAHSFTIGTNNTTAISIDDAQNTSVLISDSNTTQATLKGLVVSNSDSTTNNGSAISFAYGTNGNSFSKIGVINTDRTGGSEDQDIFFANLGGGSYSESMRIKSNGNVGIGTTNPGTVLHVYNSTQSRIGMENSARRFDIMADGDGLTIRDQSAAVNRFRINTSGNLVLGNAGVSFTSDRLQVESPSSEPVASFYRPRNTGGGGLVRFMSDVGGTQTIVAQVTSEGNFSTNGGINFGSTGGNVTSKTLDDYEEGTFTPTIDFTTTSPGGLSYFNAAGHYTKVGRVVHCTFGLGATWTSGSGGIRINGLPFTEAIGGGYREPGMAIGNTNYTGNIMRIAVIAASSSLIVYKGGNGNQLTAADMGTTFWMHGSLTYHTS